MAYQPDPVPEIVTSAQIARELRRIADELARLSMALQALEARVEALENA